MTVLRSIVGRASLLALLLAITMAKALCQTGAPVGVPAPAVAAATPAAPAAGATITLDEALRRAQANQAAFVTTLAASRSAQLDRSIARAGLLPSAVFHNQYLFTESNGFTRSPLGATDHSQLPGTSLPVFIANNAVHEYTSQGVVNETVGLAQFAAVSLADANAAKAAADLEIARRGLVSTVVGLYYGLSSAETKLANAQRSLAEANDFLKLTQQREQAREAAHADVLKAELQQQQRVRDVANAQLALNNAHLELGVLLYPDPRTAFQTEIAAPPMLPDRADVEALAGKNNAELKSALASVRASEAEVKSARAAYLPDLALNYTYGLDAPQFDATGPDAIKNLGYSASATVDIPLWDWLATEHKVKQSEIRRDAAKVALSAAQRRLIADLAEYYDEAVAARDQLASLDNSVTTARESLRLTRLRYIGGEGTVLEVVDAQDSEMAVENARADASVRYAVALANLQTLTGRF